MTWRESLLPSWPNCSIKARDFEIEHRVLTRGRKAVSLHGCFIHSRVNGLSHAVTAIFKAAGALPSRVSGNFHFQIFILCSHDIKVITYLQHLRAKMNSVYNREKHTENKSAWSKGAIRHGQLLSWENILLIFWKELVRACYTSTYLPRILNFLRVHYFPIPCWTEAKLSVCRPRYFRHVE